MNAAMHAVPGEAPVICCPVCGAALLLAPSVWRCAAGHAFDVAREGYLNLLPVQQKHSAIPGDSPESLAARRAFLEAGHYQALQVQVVNWLQDGSFAAIAGRAGLPPRSILDLGCGEGYYTQALQRVAPWVVGLDISKAAIRMAARRYRPSLAEHEPQLYWLVGTSAALPFQDAALDAVTALFTQLPVPELARVIRPGGQLLVVTPAPNHLWSFREALFGQVLAHDPEKFVEQFQDQFILAQSDTLQYALELHAADLKQLVVMTPYAWKAKPERREAVGHLPSLSTQAAFRLLRFVRKSA